MLLLAWSFQESASGNKDSVRSGEWVTTYAGAALGLSWRDGR